MNNHKLFIIICGLFLSLSIILVILIIVNFNNHNRRLELLQNISQLNTHLQKQKQDMALFSTMDKRFLDDVYFNPDKENFESYIRILLTKYGATINYYNSKKDNKKQNREYSLVTLGFTIQSTKFFYLVRECENGKKLLHIKSVLLKVVGSILKIEMVVKVFYE